MAPAARLAAHRDELTSVVPPVVADALLSGPTVPAARVAEAIAIANVVLHLLRILIAETLAGSHGRDESPKLAT